MPHALAGKPVPASSLVNIPKLVTAYYSEAPDPSVAEQRVAFGASGHRGSALRCSFNEAHIVAIAQAIAEYRKTQGTDGPLYLGIDTHALRTGARQCARGLGGQWRRSADRLRRRQPHPVRHDYVDQYVSALSDAVELDAIRASKLRLAIDPLGGAGIDYRAPIADRYGLDLTILGSGVDPTFRFMTLDWDGKIRMDCSSPYAMAGLIEKKDHFDLAFANDTIYESFLGPEHLKRVQAEAKRIVDAALAKP